MSPQTSLGRLFSSAGVPDWEVFYPEKICEKCQIRNKGRCEGSGCSALTIIGGLAVYFVNAGSSDAKTFMEGLKRTIEQLPEVEFKKFIFLKYLHGSVESLEAIVNANSIEQAVRILSENIGMELEYVRWSNDSWGIRYKNERISRSEIAFMCFLTTKTLA